MNYSEELGRRGLFELTFAFPHGGYLFHTEGTVVSFDLRMHVCIRYRTIFRHQLGRLSNRPELGSKLQYNFLHTGKSTSLQMKYSKVSLSKIFFPEEHKYCIFCVILRRESRIMSTKPVLWCAFGCFCHFCRKGNFRRHVVCIIE